MLQRTQRQGGCIRCGRKRVTLIRSRCHQEFHHLLVSCDGSSRLNRPLCFKCQELSCCSVKTSPHFVRESAPKTVPSKSSQIWSASHQCSHTDVDKSSKSGANPHVAPEHPSSPLNKDGISTSPARIPIPAFQDIEAKTTNCVLVDPTSIPSVPGRT